MSNGNGNGNGNGRNGNGRKRNGSKGKPSEPSNGDKAQGGHGGPAPTTDLKERRLICLAAPRWPVTPEHRAAYLNKLTEALRDARSPREKAMVIRVMAQLEAQNQADEHLLEKYERIDNGQATEAVANAKALPADVIDDIIHARRSRQD